MLSRTSERLRRSFERLEKLFAKLNNFPNSKTRTHRVEYEDLIIEIRSTATEINDLRGKDDSPSNKRRSSGTYDG